MKYIKLFNTDSDRVSYEGSENYIEPYVSYVKEDDSVHYSTSPFFCKLTLNNGNVVKLKGSGKLTQAMVTPYKGTLINAKIGELCTSIGEGAFYGCSGLANITIPDSITSIGDGAFCSCSSLTSVIIPDNITRIGSGTFRECTGLTSVTIGDGVTSIGQSAFANCTSLTEVTIGNSVTSIGDGAFANCSSLTEVTIPGSVTSIDFYAFMGCTSLTSITSLAITAPTIDYRTFTNVKTNGTLIVPSESNGYDNWISSNDYYLGYYNWTKVEQVETKLVVYYDIQNISVPTTIFTNYDSSVKSIEVDGKETISEFSQGNVTYQFGTVGQHIIKFEFNNPTTVGNNAPLLYNLTTAKRVVIPNTFTAIGSNAFNSSSGLTNVTIGNSVTSIGSNGFANCSGLTSITSLATTAPTIQNGTFYNTKTNGTLTVPIGSSGYDVWMNDQGNLGAYGWTKVEQ